MRQLTHYHISTGRLKAPLKLAVVSDLHNEPYEDIFPLIEGADALLVPGDISDRYHQQYQRGADFLRDAAKRMPTFFSVGNHETKQAQYHAMLRCLQRTGAQVLINHYVRFGEIWIGGWYDSDVVNRPDMLNRFDREEGVKVLMCHRPERYDKVIRQHSVDLVVAGHAHGGQIRLGNQGVYAPGQGLFPRYTRGVFDGRLVVSAGAGNPARMPRWGNPCEVLMITLD